MAVMEGAADVRGLPDLVARIRSEPRWQGVAQALARGDSGTIDGAWGSACALATAALVESPAERQEPRDTSRQSANSGQLAASAGRALDSRLSALDSTLLVVLPRLSDVDDFAVDLLSFLGRAPIVLPAWESLPTEHRVNDEVFGARLRAISLVESSAPPAVIVTSLPALLQPVPSRASRDASTRTLRVGEELELDELLKWLVERGFERESAIERPGEFAVHGGILDVYPPDAEDPLRIELFGNEIDSIRSFDAQSQRKVADLQEATLTILAPPGSEQTTNLKSEISHLKSESTTHFLDLLPAGSRIALVELPELKDEGHQYLARLDNPRGMFSVEATLERCLRRPTVTLSALAADSMETTCHLQVESIERFTGPKSDVLDELASIVGQDETVLIACHNEAEQERLGELLGVSLSPAIGSSQQSKPTSGGEGETSPAPPHPLGHRVRLCLGSVTRGFRLVSHKLLVISDPELFSRTEVRRVTRKKQRADSRAIDSFLDLNPGDHVVHLTHGIAVYRGMELLDREGGKEEHLILEFRDQVRIYVPVSLIHLVQKYVGAAKSSPTLSKVGGTLWGRQKSKVSEAVADMASDMLRLQAQRESKPGHACPIDSHFVTEFEAAFPYVETDDQVTAIDATKRDQEKHRPMDRLICGDVGFGKTEVAMRGAFKAVDAGYQVAVLVPTTILCEQHYRTFSDRMAEFPVTVASLSRFRTKAEQKAILESAAEGKVDILIGTHRLVQPDVKFKNLGLLVIDEEQRFGVDAKEMLKRLRLSVDVLTLSATPIPRTLHMSLLGIRDISNLTTPPRDRVAIETRICRWDGDLIRHAVMRELNRGGQVYFVHNRVYNIEEIKERLQQIAPEAKIVVGHGQMSDHELERAMVTFVRGKADILVATTIIESGLDIPTANTMFINQAQNYGLADLHQLRGRVGRYKHRAYCYLLLDEKKPVTGDAAKRLKAIEEYSELGAGFKIAMRDLEIRGAGNILGTEQSGHITVVGYELYCQLLESAVRKLQGLPQREAPHVNVDLPVEAYLPNSYVPPGRQKIDVYRRISATASLAELEEVSGEVRDRFGPIPAPAENLLKLRELQVLVWRWGIDNVRLEGNPFSAEPGSSATSVVADGKVGGDHRPVYAVLSYRDDQRVHDLSGALARSKFRGESGWQPTLRIVDRRNSYLLLPRKVMTGLEVLALLCQSLRSVEARAPSAGLPVEVPAVPDLAHVGEGEGEPTTADESPGTAATSRPRIDPADVRIPRAATPGTRPAANSRPAVPEPSLDTEPPLRRALKSRKGRASAD
jgi:transcription-repair coupling factor (superfamily II helicase)